MRPTIRASADDKARNGIKKLRFSADGRSIDILVVGAEQPTVLEPGPRRVATLVSSMLTAALLEEEVRLGAAFPAALCAAGRDALVESLTRALFVSLAARSVPFDTSIASISVALIVRTVAICQTVSEVPARVARVAPLPEWRLKRVVEYVDRNIDQRVRLADMAGAARLTRMHFAAQFRQSMGLSPHNYLVQKRLEHAKQLLLQEERPLAEIAICAGFGTQTHFTTVFKRYVGQTPYRWRQDAMNRPNEASC